jgi:hypothetical protein
MSLMLPAYTMGPRNCLSKRCSEEVGEGNNKNTYHTDVSNGKSPRHHGMLPAKQEDTVLDVTHGVEDHSEEVYHPGQPVARVDTVDPPRPVMVQLTFYDAHKLKRFSFHDTRVYLEILGVLSSFKRSYLSAAFAPI